MQWTMQINHATDDGIDDGMEDAMHGTIDDAVIDSVVPRARPVVPAAGEARHGGTHGHARLRPGI